MESSLSCKHCSKVYPNPDSLRNHSVRCRENPARQLLACPYCAKEFSRKDNYGVHVSKKQCKKKHCPETDCSFTYYFRTALISHMKSTHGKDFKDEETHTFQSHVEFMSWKHEIEKTSMSYYSLQTSEKMGIYSYYYCQHDGSSKSHLKGKAGQKKRECAFKGRIKTGMVCTSMMQVKKVDGQVHVTFHPNHSHAIDVDFTQCQKIFNIKQFDKLNSELSKYVHSDNFPKDLLRHVKGVLSKLIAECASACNNNNIQPTTVPNMQPTQKRTSTEKLVCQALPPKKKKKS